MRRLWTTADLIARGRTEREIRRAVERDELRVVRRGLLALPTTSDAIIRAARTGGLLTSVSAAAEVGLWVPPDLPPAQPYVFPYRPTQGRLHVAARRTTTRLHDPDDARLPLTPRDDVVVHRVEPGVIDAAMWAGVVPVLTGLAHVFRSLPPERALAVLDSALHLRHLRQRDVPALAAMLPARSRGVLASADGRADSGIETIVRHLLRLAGFHVVVHPRLDGIGEVDLLVEGRLIVETDGRQHHDDEEAFHRDRSRDLVAASSRYRVLRLTWRQVLFEWPSVEAAVAAALA